MFDPVTGELKVLTAFGGYQSFQHWWSENCAHPSWLT
jgi:hypothetical protein